MSLNRKENERNTKVKRTEDLKKDEQNTHTKKKI